MGVEHGSGEPRPSRADAAPGGDGGADAARALPSRLVAARLAPETGFATEVLSPPPVPSLAALRAAADAHVHDRPPPGDGAGD